MDIDGMASQAGDQAMRLCGLGQEGDWTKEGALGHGEEETCMREPAYGIVKQSELPKMPPSNQIYYSKSVVVLVYLDPPTTKMNGLNRLDVL